MKESKEKALPPLRDMVLLAIVALKQPNGSSLGDITKYIKNKWVSKDKGGIEICLRRAIEVKKIVKNGSFYKFRKNTISKEEKKYKKVKTSPKKLPKKAPTYKLKHRERSRKRVTKRPKRTVKKITKKSPVEKEVKTRSVVERARKKATKRLNRPIITRKRGALSKSKRTYKDTKKLAKKALKIKKYKRVRRSHKTIRKTRK